MPENKSQYIVSLGADKTLNWNAATLEANSEKLAKDFPDAQVYQIDDYDATEEPNEEFSYLVNIGNNTLQWNAATLGANKEKLYKDYPDAKVQKVSAWKNPYLKSESQIAKENLDVFRAENGSFMDDYEARDTAERKTATANAMRGIFVPPMEGAISGEERVRYLELSKQEEDLKKAYYNSPDVVNARLQRGESISTMQSEIEKALSNLESNNPEAFLEMRQASVRRSNPRTALMSSKPLSIDAQEIQADYSNYTAAQSLLNDAIKINNAPSRYDSSNGFVNFMKGMGNTFSDVDFWSAGLTEIAKNMKLRGVLSTVQKKLGSLDDLSEEAVDAILTDSEKKVLAAFVINTDAQYDRAEDLSRALQAGQSAAESLGFMAEFILTGGIAKGATQIAESAANKVLRGYLGKLAGKVSKTAIGKYATRLAGDVIGAAARTLVLPSTYRNMSQQAIQIKEDPETGERKLASISESVARGFADSFIEALAEGGRVGAIGDFFGDALGSIKSAKKFMDKVKKSDIAQLFKTINNSEALSVLRAGGWHGIGEEYLEEWYGAALRTLTNLEPEALKDFASVDNQLITLTSFLPMTLIGGTISTGQVVHSRKDLEKKAAILKSAMIERGYSEDQANLLVDNLRTAPMQNISDTFTPMVNKIAQQENGNAPELMKAVANFAMASARVQSYGIAYEEQEARQRRNLLNEMYEQIGRFWQEDAEGNRSVELSTMEDGTPVYILQRESQEVSVDGEITPAGPEAMAIDMNGMVRFINNIGESETMGLDDYLNVRLIERRGAEEESRVAQEAEQRINDIKSQIVLNQTVLNMGTQENPIEGLVVGMTANGVMVQTQEGATPLTWDEVGNKLSLPNTVMTDAQIEEAEVANLDAQQAAREAMLDEQFDDPVAEETEIAEGEEAEAVAEKATYNYPRKADGSVDGNALWNENVREWIKWNNQRIAEKYGVSDNGADSVNYLQNQIASLERSAKKIASNKNKETDFDKKVQLEDNEIAVNKRLAELRDILAEMTGETAVEAVTETIAEETPAEPAPEVSESTESEEDTDRLTSEIVSLMDGTLTDSEIDDYINNNIKKAQKELTAHNKKTPKIGTDKQQYLEEKKKHQAKVEQIQSEIDFWNEVKSTLETIRGTYIPAQGEIVNKDYDLTPLTPAELVADFFGSISSNAPKIRKDSFLRHTGYSESDAKALGFFLRKNSGITMEEMAERIESYDQEQGYNILDHSDPMAGMNALLEAFSEIKSHWEMFSMIKNNRRAQAESEAKAAYDAMLYEIEQAEHMTIDEFETYKEVIARDIVNGALTDAQIYELNSIFAEDYYAYENNEINSGRKDTNVEPDVTRRDNGIREDRNPLLQGEQLDNSGDGRRAEERSSENSRSGNQQDGNAPSGVGVDSSEGRTAEGVNGYGEGTEIVEPDNDGERKADSAGVAGDSAAEVSRAGNRSDIRVFEEGLESSRSSYSDASERDRREAESQRLINIAKANGLYVPIEETANLGVKVQKRTGESVVYINEEEGKVYKVKDPYAKSAMKAGVEPEDAIFEFLIHNILFPETAYTFVGITEQFGEVRIILSQDYVSAYERPTQQQIADALAERGLQPETRYSFANDLVSITDVEGDNVILGEDGTLYFIDPIIRFKKPVREILDTLSPEAESVGETEDIGDIPDDIWESSLDEDMPDFTNSASAYFPTAEMRQKFSAMRTRINEWAQKLGVQVRIMETLDDVVNQSARREILMGGKVYGYFDPATGEVAIYLPDYLSFSEADALSEIDKTYIHEVVSHRGLRGLLGEEKYGEFCDKVWEAMTDTQRQRYLNYPGVNGNTRVAADEFIANFAESVNYEDNRTMWDKIVDFIKNLFNSVGIPVEISNESMAELLRASYNKLASEASERVSSEKISLEDYLGRLGLSSPISDYMDDKLRNPHGLSESQRNQLEKDAANAAEDYHSRRRNAIEEYNRLVSEGKIVPATQIDKLLAVANGHPDNAATQAARRSLEKRGYDWQTGQKKSAEVKSEQKTEKAEKKTASSRSTVGTKIEDFGEKIGGARKDAARSKIRDAAKLTRTDLKKLNDPDKILSRKQIIKYVAEGQMTTEDAQTLLAVNMAVRGESYTQKEVALEKYRDLALAWESGKDLTFEITEQDIDTIYETYSQKIKDAIPELRDRIRKSFEKSLMLNFKGYLATYQELNYPAENRDLKGTYVRYGIYDSKYWVVSGPNARRGWSHSTMGDAIARIKKDFPIIQVAGKASKDENGKETYGHLYVVKGKYYGYQIKSRDIPGDIYMSSKVFPTRKLAEAYIAENAERLMEKERAMAEALMGSDIGMVERQGKDYRNGKDVTPQDFMDTFKFRGVEFGNWVPQAERQMYLNKTYDAIMDFCEVVGISPKAFSLGGRLGLAFGARGKSRALAHYEQMKEVINLTRMKGAGSLAHEWFHALDNFLAKQNSGDTSDMATASRKTVREEVSAAFDAFVRKMNSLEYTKRSYRAGDYWGEVWERAARLFENYVYNELGGKGTVSPLLVRKDVLFDESDESTSAAWWPYPSAKENEEMKPYFDALFDAIQEQAQEDGSVVLYRSKPDRDENVAGLESLVERTFRTSGAFSFSGKETIESRDDVAFIFRQLEDSAIENAFLVFVKDGVPTIVHVGMGGTTYTMIDNSVVLPAYKDFGADKVYMVHNHPSGALYASRQDIEMLGTIQDMLPDVTVEGIIINTVSGNYSTFDWLGKTAESAIPDEGETIDLEVLSFDRNVFSPDYKSEISKRKIQGPEDIASFLSAHRLGEGTKVGALLLNRQNAIYGNLVTNDNEVSMDTADDLATQIAEAANRTGSSSVILFGDFDYSDRAIKKLEKSIKRISGDTVNMLDVVRLEGKHTQSLMEQTLPSRATLSDGVRYRASNENQEIFISNAARAVEGIKVEDMYFPGLEGGLTMHSVPVTEEMKASVMEGQVMFRMRGENESAMDFTQSVVDEYKSQYNELGDLQVLPVNEETAERFGLTLEQLKKKDGHFDPETQIISIFANEDNVDSDEVENTIFHEDIHFIADFYPHMDKLGQWMWENASINKGFEKLKAAIESTDDESWYHQEMLTNMVSVMLSMGATEEFEQLIPEDYRSIVKHIENEIGYDRQAEASRRKDRRNSINTKGATTPSVRKGKDSQTSGSESLTAEERRIINDYFPGAFPEEENDTQPDNTGEFSTENNDIRYRAVPLDATPTDEVVAEGLDITDRQVVELAGNLFAAFPADIRKKITDRMNGNPLNLQNAIFAIPAELAEKESLNDEERSIASIITREVQSIIDTPMTRDLHISEALWMLYDRVFPTSSYDLVGAAKKAQIKDNLGFSERKLKEKQDDIRYRAATQAEIDAMERNMTAADLYNRDVTSALMRLRESFQDMNRSVQKMVDAVVKKTGKAVKSFEDIMLALNQLSSKNLSDKGNYLRNFLMPMWDAVLAFKEKGKTLDDVIRYVMLKHGLERNDVLAQRDARNYYKEAYDKKVRDIEADKSLSDTEKQDKKDKAKDDYDFHIASIQAGTDAKYRELRERDYGAIMALYSDYMDIPDRMPGETIEQFNQRQRMARLPKYTDLAVAEAEAAREVEAFENANRALCDRLWKRINAATKETLKHQYEHNVISKQTYDHVRGMFEFYIPLRGFKEDTAEDIYSYYGKDVSTDFANPLIRTKGRTTLAESPFGWIGSMAESAIQMDNKNDAKMRLYYFALNRPAQNLLTLQKTWYKKVGEDSDGRSIWEASYPNITPDMDHNQTRQEIERHDAEMKALAASGQATQKKSELNLRNSVVNISDKAKPEHAITVLINGEEQVMYVNGNPRAAQAINGMLNIDKGDSGLYRILGQKITRWMSRMNTSYNPAFWISNYERDLLFTIMSINVKEDKAYRDLFWSNYVNPVKVTQLLRKYEKGELDMSNPVEKAYKEFADNGGITGFTVLANNEEYDKLLDKYSRDVERSKFIKGAQYTLGLIQDFGEGAEQASRFAAYMTSRQVGRSIEESIGDAKEVTVNFNRKGSGKAISWEETGNLSYGRYIDSHPNLKWCARVMTMLVSSMAPAGRSVYMFFNASIQGLKAFVSLYKKNPGKAAMWSGAYFGLGFALAALNHMINAIAGGDDDDYLDIPDWERRNNIIIGGNGFYIKWALPQEARPFYAVADIILNKALGRSPDENLVEQVGRALLEVLPVNPLGEGGFAQAVVPSALSPLYEIWQNTDYKGMPLYRESYWSTGEEPKYDKAFSGTGKVFVEISRLLNEASGGDYAEAGAINIHPAAIEHLIEGYGGGTVTFFNQLLKTFTGNYFTGEWTVRNAPFLNRVVTINDERYRNSHTSDVFKHYENLAKDTKRIYNVYKSNDDVDKLDELKDQKRYDIMKIYERYSKKEERYDELIRDAEDERERRELMAEQDEIRREMIKEISEL